MQLPNEIKLNEYYAKIFKNINSLCEKFQYEKANILLNRKLKKVEFLNDNYNLKQYYYYNGLTLLLGKNNIDESEENFELALETNGGYQNEFLNTMITNMYGVISIMKEDVVTAKYYFEKSLFELEELMDYGAENFEKTLLVIYNCAKFFSGLNDYKKSISLCNIGIDFAVSENIMPHLEKIYYEKAFNLAKLKKFEKAEKFYFQAYALCMIKRNSTLIEVINKDMIEFKLKLKATN